MTKRDRANEELVQERPESLWERQYKRLAPELIEGADEN